MSAQYVQNIDAVRARLRVIADMTYLLERDQELRNGSMKNVELERHLAPIFDNLHALKREANP